MRFKVEYVNRKTGANYWLTIHGDNHSEVMKEADKFTRKGYIRISMTQVDYKTA